MALIDDLVAEDKLASGVRACVRVARGCGSCVVVVKTTLAVNHSVPLRAPQSCCSPRGSSPLCILINSLHSSSTHTHTHTHTRTQAGRQASQKTLLRLWNEHIWQKPKGTETGRAAVRGVLIHVADHVDLSRLNALTTRT